MVPTLYNSTALPVNLSPSQTPFIALWTLEMSSMKMVFTNICSYGAYSIQFHSSSCKSLTLYDAIHCTMDTGNVLHENGVHKHMFLWCLLYIQNQRHAWPSISFAGCIFPKRPRHSQPYFITHSTLELLEHLKNWTDHRNLETRN